MYTEYNKMPDNSRVWIYQANRKLLVEEIEYISAKAINFVEQWTRHGEDLKASFTIKYNQFLILVVDESFNDVSGCSIDASVRFIKEIEQQLKIDMTDKTNIAFKTNNNIQLIKLSDLQEHLKKKTITPDTIVFNNMVNTKKDFEKNWEIPAKQSWHKKFIA